MLRGGSWNNNNPDNLRAAYRNNNQPENRNNNIGLRFARPSQHSQPPTGIPAFKEAESAFGGVPIRLPGLA
ncbi:MAG: SUMF1/EgtB/PvdO family nonheme iron enzyme [Candidatus Binatia bacterium]